MESVRWAAGDYDNGDIWYFPGNFPHVVLGVDPEFGCTYLTSYDQGDFDERLDAQGLSGWYTQAPAAIAAQVAQPTIYCPYLEVTAPAQPVHVRTCRTAVDSHTDLASRQTANLLWSKAFACY